MVICFSVGSVHAETYPSRLWKVESSNASQSPSYLLGTMHLADKDIVSLPDHIQQIVDQANSLAIEVKLNGNAQKTMADLSVLRGNYTLSDLIGKPQFQKVVGIFRQKGFTEIGLERLKPWAVALMLNYPPPTLDPILDYSLQLNFKKQNKPIYQLETAEEQIAIFNGLTTEQQIGFLQYALKQQKHFDQYLSRMKQLYINDDLDGLQELASEQMTEIKSPYLKDLFKKLIDQRNIKMVNRMQMHLKTGNALIAVGALHLTGGKGIIQLLRFQGYKVTPVIADQ